MGKNKKKQRGDEGTPLPVDIQKELARIQSVCKGLDALLSCCTGCCNCGIGLDPLIGLIPAIGDFAGTILGILVVIRASHLLRQARAYSSRVILKMILNVLFDCLIGFVPIFGDICDALYKSNMYNYDMLETHLRVTLEKEMVRLKEVATEAVKNAVDNALDASAPPPPTMV